jgi:outer membrane cobalamin receptor
MNISTRLYIGLITLFLPFIQAHYCYGAEELSSASLSSITVTATRYSSDISNIPQSVTIISSDEIKKSPAKSIGELINTVTGINLESYGGAGSQQNIDIRGSTNAQVLILINGKRLNNSLNGGYDLSSLPVALENIDRVEILRGESSALYSSDAMAGVINIITKQVNKHSTTLKLSDGSFNTLKEYIATQDKSDKTAYSISYSNENSDGYRPNSKLNNNIYNAALKYNLTPLQDVELSLNHINRTVQVPGSTTFPIVNGLQDDNNTGLNLKYNNLIAPWLDITAIYSHSNNIMHYSDSFSNDTHQLLANDFEAQANAYLSDTNILNTGIAINDDKSNSTAIGTHGYTTSGIFLQDSINYGQINANAGMRYDNNSLFGSQISPKAGLLYKIAQNWQLKATVGRGYRAPTLNDLYWPNAAGVKGNPNLIPETSTNYDYGIIYSNDNSRLNITLFNRDVSNLIQWVPDAFFVFSPQNIGKANISGIEAEYSLKISDKTNLRASYTNTVPKNSVNNTYIANIDMQKISLGIDFLAFFDSIISISGVYQNRIVSSSAPYQAITKDWMVINAKISKDIGSSKIYLQVNNLFNTQYENIPGYPAAPQSMEAGWNVEF